MKGSSTTKAKFCLGKVLGQKARFACKRAIPSFGVKERFPSKEGLGGRREVHTVRVRNTD